jgi:CheY-like chemotaxis protein/PAS domain-containing protein
VLLGASQAHAEDVARALGDRFEIVLGDHPPLPAEAGLKGIGPQQAAAILEAIGEGVCLASADGEIIWANERFRGYDDQTRARIAAVCRRGAQRFEEQRASGGEDGWPEGSKFEVATPDGTRFFEVLVSPVGPDIVPMGPSPGDAPEEASFAAASGPGGGDGPGRTTAVVAAVVWDVTTSHRARLKMEAIDRAGRELVRLDAESIRKMHVGERLKLLEEKIVKFAHDLMNFDHFTIRLLDERTGKLELVMASGLPPEALEVELFAEQEGSGITGYVAATGRSYLCPDVTRDRRYIRGLTNARSSLTVPLLLHDKVIGVFNAESEVPAAFTEEDRQFAEMFANHVALALHILDLLVVERCATGETVTGTVQGELSEPLQDIVKEADWLKQANGHNAEIKRHVDRILADVEAIKRRLSDAASGPQHILGVEKALVDLAIDPMLVGKQVLVADDEPKIRQVIRDVLGGRGCRVTVCENGQAAIDALERAGVTGMHFDLVISDIKMPDRNGYEVFSAARRVDADVPVILMTGFGYDPHHSIVRASQEGLQCVLFKPFQVERLMEEVRKAVGARASAGR